MNRRPGLAHTRNPTVVAAIASSFATQRSEHIAAQLATFKEKLEGFAAAHRAEIARDPVFRTHFLALAREVGVDPLASSKSVWASTLGVGGFYFDLAVAAAGVCIASRPVDGGLLSLHELTRRLRAARGSAAGAISEDDVSRALSKLSVLGGGFAEVMLGGERYVRSLPDELDTDAAAVLTIAAVSSGAAVAPEGVGGKGWVTISDVRTGCGWPAERAARALSALMQDGLAWVDTQVPRGASGGGEPQHRFYLPSVGPPMGLGADA